MTRHHMPKAMLQATSLVLLYGLGLTAHFHSHAGESSGKLPEGWLATQTGAGQSAWHLVTDSATPAMIIEQSGTADYPLCLRTNVSLRDGYVEVRFQPLAGVKDQAGGVVWRARDASNYYICRANAHRNQRRSLQGGQRQT